MAIPGKEDDDNNSNDRNDEGEDNDNEGSERVMANREERRKAAKKEKRKQKRRELAELARREEEARLNDPAVQMQLQAEEEREKERAERERIEFEERERMLLETWERKRTQEAEEEEGRKALEEEEKLKRRQVGSENEVDEDGWEYVEEGPPEIIWLGNEIIVKKKKVRVKKKDTDHQIVKEDPNRPTSNPLPPQNFADYKNEPIVSAQQLLENVAQQTPNFGTEQDKAHCPFHLKTGACRFGSSCSRIHFYPDKSCTLLIKNMYNGPGLSWEQDEGLENNISEWKKVERSFLAEFRSKDVALLIGSFYQGCQRSPFTDEEVERAYEEFYEDVHTEFLKFGELVNFKVCRNGSSHLRGNVYVHYRSLDSALVAYQTINGRYFAGKRVQCEYVGLTKWKVAICGEFMKSKLKSCSRGMACNFIHCFRNPGGDYEWADWDKPPPKYWVKKMAALFGYSDESGYEKQFEHESPRLRSNSHRTSTYDEDRFHYQRSQSRDSDYPRRISRKYSEDHDIGRTPQRHEEKHYKDSSSSRKTPLGKSPSSDYDSDKDRFERESSRDGHRDRLRKSSRHRNDGKMESHDSQSYRKRTGESDVNANLSDLERDKYSHRGHERKSRRVERKKSLDLDKDGVINSSTDRLDDNRRTTMCLSDTTRGTGRHHEASALPDDRRDDRISSYDNVLKGELCNDHWQPAMIAMECEAQRANRAKHSNSWDNRKSSSYGRNYRYSDYDSDSSSGQLASEKRSSKNLKISKRKQDTDRNCNSGDGVKYHDENEMHDNVYHEDVDKRGRWEPDEEVSFKHNSNKRKLHGKDHIREPKRNDNSSESSDEHCNDGKLPHSSRSSKRKHNSGLEQRNSSKRLRI